MNQLSFQNIKQPLIAFLVSRFLVIFIVVLASHFTAKEVAFKDFKIASPELRLTFETAKTRLKHICTTADSGWYFGISKGGYAKEDFSNDMQRNWAFFPLYPIVLKGISLFFGESIKAVVVFNNLLLLFALILLHQYSLALTNERRSANLVTWFAAIHPVGYFYSVPVTESLFFVLTIGSFFLVHKGSPIKAGVLIALATATRATGFLLIPAFFFALIRNKSIAAKKVALALLISPLGLVAFMVYLHSISGNYLAFYDVQYAWGRNRESFFELIRKLINDPLWVMHDWNFIWLHIGATLLAFVAGFHFLRRKEFHFACIVLIPILAALWTGKWISIARFTLVLFPIYFYLAAISKNETVEKIIFIVFASLLGIMAALFGAQVTASMA